MEYDIKLLDMLAIPITVLLIFLFIRGVIYAIKRHNSMLVVLYLILLFPIAFIHMVIFGCIPWRKKDKASSDQ